MSEEKKPVYKTEFVNRRSDQSAQIMFADSPSGIFVPPNSSFELETEDALDLYAKYSKIQYMKNNDVKLTERAGWKDIEGTLDYGSLYVVKFFNRDGANWESVYLGGEHNRPTLIPRGIPRYLGVPLDSMYVRFKEYIWQFEIRKKQISGTSYSTEEWGLQRYGIERDKKELKEIGILITERDVKNATDVAKRNVDVYIKERGLS